MATWNKDWFDFRDSIRIEDFGELKLEIFHKRYENKWDELQYRICSQVHENIEDYIWDNDDQDILF